VDESEALDLKAAAQTYEELRQGPFAGVRLGLLHGRMEEAEKAEVMSRFRAGDVQLLVCTSVVEVGIDVPNATLMVVEHAERFGLSQLHQLRGRVSRGREAGQCYLFAAPANEEARERLRVFVRAQDGFALAEADARLRGLGQFFGTRQHGLGELRLGDLAADLELLQEARRDALAMVSADAQLQAPEHDALRRVILERYGAALELAEVG
jgi:ATP-dependent DNA helicase RecG